LKNRADCHASTKRDRRRREKLVVQNYRFEAIRSDVTEDRAPGEPRAEYSKSSIRAIIDQLTTSQKPR
jgi:hypothetical protein